MITIKYSPQYRDDTLTISKTGDKLTINNVEYDFTQLQAGSTLPKEAIDCEFICGDVERDSNNNLIVPILLPNNQQSTEAARFPSPVNITDDGNITLPE